MNEVSDFYKNWVRFLKSKKLYGRYLLDIQSANRLIEERKSYMFNWADINLSFSSKKSVYLTKCDAFNSRFAMEDLYNLKWHLWDLECYLDAQEIMFLDNAYKQYQLLLMFEKEEKKKRELPIPRGFRNRKNRNRIKGSSEENKPWYNSYYQDRKVLWRR